MQQEVPLSSLDLRARTSPQVKRTQAGPGRTVKEQQEQISPNLERTFVELPWADSPLLHLREGPGGGLLLPGQRHLALRGGGRPRLPRRRTRPLQLPRPLLQRRPAALRTRLKVAQPGPVIYRSCLVKVANRLRDD